MQNPFVSCLLVAIIHDCNVYVNIFRHFCEVDGLSHFRLSIFAALATNYFVSSSSMFWHLFIKFIRMMVSLMLSHLSQIIPLTPTATSNEVYYFKIWKMPTFSVTNLWQ